MVERPVNLFPHLTKYFPLDACLERCYYPSSDWPFKKQSTYFKRTDRCKKKGVTVEKPDFLINRYENLTAKGNTPQKKTAFHIHRIYNEPVCKVNTLAQGKPEIVDYKETAYRNSYPFKKLPAERLLVLRSMKEKMAEGIVPSTDLQPIRNISAEMLLPPYDSTEMPCVTNPHKYVLRKRKLKQPVPDSGIIYHTDCFNGYRNKRENGLRLMKSPVSISSLCGQSFTRKKYLPPPTANLQVSGFDGGAPALPNKPFLAAFLPVTKSPDIL